jgi:hypothetical protein
VIYKVTVPAGQRVTAKVTPATGMMLSDGGVLQYDPSIYLMPAPAAACSMNSCLVGADTSTDPAQPETVSWLNGGTMPTDLFIVIDSSWTASAGAMAAGYLDTGAFTLDVSLATPPPGDTCATALPLVAGTPLTAQTIANFGDDYSDSSATGCVFSAGPDRAYTLTVPAGQQALIVATPTSTLDVAVSVADSVASCGVSCVASADVGIAGNPETIAWTNHGTTAATILVIVEEYPTSPMSTGTFDLSATVRMPPADDVCSGATALAANTTVPGTTVGYGNDYDPGASGVATCAFTTSGPDRVYSFTVPNGQRATVTMTDPTDGGFVPSLSFVQTPASNCDAMPLVCVGAADSPPGFLFNVTGADQQYFAIVDGDTSGEYAISYTTAVPPVDDTCTTSMTALTSGVVLANQTVAGFTKDYGSVTGCANSFGEDRVYKIAVPAGEKLTATVTPTTQADGGAMDAVLELVPAPSTNCDGTMAMCATAADNGQAGDPETTGYVNTSASAEDVYVIVANYHSPPNTTGLGFSVVATVAAPPPGETCANAKTLTTGTLTNESLGGGLSRDYGTLQNDTSCAPYSGVDRVYVATLTANQTLTAVATPVAPDGGSADQVSLELVDGPATACVTATTCLAASSGNSGAQTATYQNASGATKTVFLIVGAQSSGTTPTYNLVTTIQ